MTQEIRLPETLMNKAEGYTLSKEERAKLVEVATRLLEEYDYDFTDDGINAIIDEWIANKGWLVNLFSQHENYNGNFQIVLPTTLKRPVDHDGINKFVDWAIEELKKSLPEIRIGMFGAYEYEEMFNAVDRIVDKLSYLENSAGSGIVYKGRTFDEWRAERRRMQNTINKARTNYDDWKTICANDGYKYVSRQDYNKYRAVSQIFHRLLSRCGIKELPNIINGDDCLLLKEYADTIGIKMTEGLKVAKYIRKILVKFGIDKVVDLHEQAWDTTDNDGNITHHTRMVDMGYNYYFALLGDSINPMEVPSEVVLSVNPIDYWTMSFGYKWASCHTIDKENRRGNDKNYSGCYSSGTESYMLDPSSFIVYSRPDAKRLEKIGETDLPLELQSKMKRCVFMLGEDKLVQSRLYPDGRDGGDEGLAGQFRNIVQTTIAGLYHTSNLWTLKSGRRACYDVVDTASEATHYEDYNEYEDCNVSYLRRVDGLLNTNPIAVGAMPICPCCGEGHESNEWITCEDCREEVCCEDCGAVLSRRYGEGIEVNGHRFCDGCCARRSGWVETEDDGWCREDDGLYEESTDTWWRDTYEGVYIEGVGEWFHNEEAAEDAGYVYCEYGDEWAYESDAYEVGDTGIYFSICHYDGYFETEDGKYFPTEECAENHGYIRQADGSWVKNTEVA